MSVTDRLRVPPHRRLPIIVGVIVGGLVAYGAYHSIKPFLEKNPVAAQVSALPPPSAYKSTPANDAMLRQFVSDVLRFTLLHEMGHMVIAVYHVPVLGREEDAADRFATAVMTAKLSDGAPRQHNIVLSAAMFFDAIHTLNQESAPGQYDWADEHGEPRQRADMISCLLFGADPSAYTDLAKDIGLDSDRQARCVRDAAKNRTDWGGVISASLNTETGAFSGANSPTVAVLYHPVANRLTGEVREQQERAREVAQKMGTLDDIAADIKLLREPPRTKISTARVRSWDELMDLDNNVQHPANGADLSLYDYTVVGDSCLDKDGQPQVNAFWDPNTHSIVLCYALVDSIAGVGESLIARATQSKR